MAYIFSTIDNRIEEITLVRGQRIAVKAHTTDQNPPRPAPGNGYLAGDFPEGITTIEGVPTAATVRILYRPDPGSIGDGAVVAEVESAPDGTWRVDGLDPSLKFDVVGRKNGHNDVIMANVTPEVE